MRPGIAPVPPSVREEAWLGTGSDKTRAGLPYHAYSEGGMTPRSIASPASQSAFSEGGRFQSEVTSRAPSVRLRLPSSASTHGSWNTSNSGNSKHRMGHMDGLESGRLRAGRRLGNAGKAAVAPPTRRHQGWPAAASGESTRPVHISIDTTARSVKRVQASKPSWARRQPPGLS